MQSFQCSYNLLCPGPVNVHPEVAAALTSYEFCHREEEFEALFNALQSNILEVAGLKPGKGCRYSAVVITGSGTAANETVLSSVVREEAPVLVISNGEFGERLARISRLYHPNTTCISHPWGESFDLDRVQAHLDAHPTSLIAMAHHETSTGMLNPIQAVGAMAKAHGATFFVDAVSSFSADPIDLDGCNVDFMSSSAGKAIGCYPGLSIVIGKHSSFQDIGKFPPRTRYLSLHRYYEFAEQRSQTPNTPAVPLFLALNRSFELALEEGMPERFARFRSLNAHVRMRLEQMGIDTLLPSSLCSSTLTSACLPAGVPFEGLRQAMRAKGFVMYEGKGPMQNKIFQVSTLGMLPLEIIDHFFAELSNALSSFGFSRPSLLASNTSTSHTKSASPTV